MFQINNLNIYSTFYTHSTYTLPRKYNPFKCFKNIKVVLMWLHDICLKWSFSTMTPLSFTSRKMYVFRCNSFMTFIQPLWSMSNVQQKIWSLWEEENVHSLFSIMLWYWLMVSVKVQTFYPSYRLKIHSFKNKWSTSLESCNGILYILLIIWLFVF